MSATSRAVRKIGSAGILTRELRSGDLVPSGDLLSADRGSLTGARFDGRATLTRLVPRSRLSDAGSRSGSKVAEASRGGLSPAAPSPDHRSHVRQRRRWEHSPHLGVAGLMPPDTGDRPDPREQSRPGRVDGEIRAIEPLDLPVPPGDHREALAIEPNAEPMRLRQSTEVLRRALFERRLSANRVLRHRVAEWPRAKSEEHARRGRLGVAGASGREVSDAAQLGARRHRDRDVTTDAKRRDAMEIASPGLLHARRPTHRRRMAERSPRVGRCAHSGAWRPSVALHSRRRPADD